ncbi:transcription factor bHLH162 [Syzygium oleosum]|uniref:transcription factor bHLH162 n=1 Tax=Syzygium oleosum TaxID=219896 RepID=UPI0024BBE993|nr:transcription factor bHLH162 [Syzygium oleosum]XP_030467867.2 transcription factor bHLH162 [Syzygium oleosum]
MENSPSSSRNDRKLIERNRRHQMKALYSQLNSLVPHPSSTEVTSLPDQLHEATKYIKQLQINLEKMTEKKESLLGMEKQNASMDCGMNAAPAIEIHQNGSALHVVLITGLDHQFMFNRVIGLLHEERVEILNASFSVLDDTTFHSIHCEVGDCAPSLDSARISERLRKCVQDNAQR